MPLSPGRGAAGPGPEALAQKARRLLLSKAPLVVFLVALVCRVTFVLVTDSGSLSMDGSNWADQGASIAQNMLAGRGYVVSYSVCENFRSFRMPVLPLLLWAVWSITGFSTLAAKLVMAVVGAIGATLVVPLGSRLVDRRVGLLGGLVAAVFPSQVYWSGCLGTEALTSCLLVGSIVLLQESLTPRRLFMSGLAIGLLVLTRPVFFPYALLVGAWVGLEKYRRRETLYAGLYLAALAVALLPWVGRNWAIHHSLVLGSTEGGLTFVECNSPAALEQNQGEWDPGLAESQPEIVAAAHRLPEVALNRWLYRKGLGYVRERPLAFAEAMARRVWYLWRPVPRLYAGGYTWKHVVVMGVTWPPVLLLAIFAVLRLRLFDLRAHGPIWLALLWVTCSAALIRGSIRYRAPVEPLVICFAAAGGLALAKRTRHRSA